MVNRGRIPLKGQSDSKEEEEQFIWAVPLFCISSIGNMAGTLNRCTMGGGLIFKRHFFQFSELIGRVLINDVQPVLK